MFLYLLNYRSKEVAEISNIVIALHVTQVIMEIYTIRKTGTIDETLLEDI